MHDDDPIQIPDRTRLFRRIDPAKVVYDKNRGERRPTSENFQNSKDGTPMSVFAENIAIVNGEFPRDFLRGHWSNWLLAALPAGWMREHGQKVYLDTENQDADDRHPSHAAVDGPKDRKIRPKLAEKYEWIIPPERRFDPPDS